MTAKLNEKEIDDNNNEEIDGAMIVPAQEGDITDCDIICVLYDEVYKISALDYAVCDIKEEIDNEYNFELTVEEEDVLEFIVQMQINDEINIINQNTLQIKYKDDLENLNNTIIQYKKNVIEMNKELDICVDIINKFKNREDIWLKKLNRSNNGIRLLMREEHIKQTEINNLLENIRIKDEIITQLNKDKDMNQCCINNMQKAFERKIKEIKQNLYTPELECVFVSENNNYIDDISNINKTPYTPELEIVFVSENNFVDET
eukprot:206501_1